MVQLFDKLYVFDGGDHTGFILYNVKHRHIEDMDIFMTYEDIYNCIKNIDSNTSCVVSENVAGTIDNAKQIRMCKKVGFIEGLCDSLGITLYPQTPPSRVSLKPHARKYIKHMYGKRVLKFSKFIKFENHMEHNVDAFSHCLVWLHNKYGMGGINYYVKREYL